MKLIKMTIEYDGSRYHGWQTQPSGLTLHDVICGAVTGITGETINLTSASRTDSGVHALGQVAAFCTHTSLPAATLMRALNAVLPRDIRILEAVEGDGAFHPRYHAAKKSYFYLIEKAKKQSVFSYRYAWGIPVGLDLDSMVQAASLLEGRHDFSAFRGAGCGAKTTVRTVHSITLDRYGSIDFMTAALRGDFIKIRIEANAFLRHMVRNIVGTLVEVGRGRIPLDQVNGILASCNRNMAGPTAPAKGLFLEKVYYGDAC